MKVRLRDWASLNCISERTVQVHIKELGEALEGHIERKGKNGTWLDDYAQELLINSIQLPSRQEIYQPTARESALLIELKEVHELLAAAERDARLNAEAAGRVKLLEGIKDEQEGRIIDLSRQIGELTQKEAQARREAEELAQKLAAYKALPWYKKVFSKE